MGPRTVELPVVASVVLAARAVVWGQLVVLAAVWAVAGSAANSNLMPLISVEPAMVAQHRAPR